MGQESEPGRFIGRGRYWGRSRGWGSGGFKNSSSSSSYKLEEVKFVTISSKQVYANTAVKCVIFQIVKILYGYEVASSLRHLE